VDFAGTEKMVKRSIDDKEYYWIKYEGILTDLPILSITKDTLYRRLKGLVEKEVLEHTTVKEAGTYSFYRLGKNYLSLISDQLSEKNPTGYGKKSDRGTEKNPYQNTNLINNKSTKKSTLPTVEEQALSKLKKLSYADILSEDDNKYVREALEKFLSYCRGKNYTPKISTVTEFASVLRENAGEDPALAMAIVDQSIESGWKALYPLKKYGQQKRATAVSKQWSGETAKDDSGNDLVY
jgi:hypothetical protein